MQPVRFFAFVLIFFYFDIFSDIQKQCALFLASHLEPANCLGIYCFADLHNCSQLKQAGKNQNHIFNKINLKF